MTNNPSVPVAAGSTRRSPGWYLSIGIGGVLIVVSAARAGPVLSTLPAAFWAVAALVLLGQLRPVRVARENDSSAGTVTSTAFLFAILYAWGLWAAVLLAAVVTLTSELVRRGDLRTRAFNVCEPVLAVAASWLVLAAVGLPDGVADVGQELHGVDLLWVVPTWVVWFVVDQALLAGERTTVGTSFGQAFRHDIVYSALAKAAVLALSPLVVVSAHESPWFMLVMLIPLVAVHRTARASLDEQHKALHDSLTGLPNRKLLLQTLTEELRCEEPKPFVLAIVDLDRFKDVNDTLGHQVGDRLLIMVAERISGALRSRDMVARLGGDEFAIYLADVSSDRAAMELAVRIRDSLVEPFQLDEMLLEVEASIGIALHPEHGDDVEELMRRADVAMYLAKEHQTGVEIYDQHRDRNSTDRLGLLTALRRALDTGQLELYYQPKVALFDRQVVGVEALVRWNHPTRGFIPPDEFVPLAETSGLMYRLTAFVVDSALEQVAAWRAVGLTVAVAVNVSARDLHGTDLVRVVSESLARHRVPARQLQLEVTERTVMAESSRVVDSLIALQALDVSLSLDDFGTGYSSMLLLKTLPVSEIKVDRSFVSRLTEAGHDVSIVRSIIDLAHAMGLLAVAEGVETEEVWTQLAALGCDIAQGWLVSRPMPADAATEWLLTDVRRAELARVGLEPASLRVV